MFGAAIVASLVAAHSAASCSHFRFPLGLGISQVKLLVNAFFLSASVCLQYILSMAVYFAVPRSGSKLLYCCHKIIFLSF